MKSNCSSPDEKGAKGDESDHNSSLETQPPATNVESPAKSTSEMNTTDKSRKSHRQKVACVPKKIKKSRKSMEMSRREKKVIDLINIFEEMDEEALEKVEIQDVIRKHTGYITREDVVRLIRKMLRRWNHRIRSARRVLRRKVSLLDKLGYYIDRKSD